MNPSYVDLSGLREFAGGIIPARSFRTTNSHLSGCSLTRAGSRSSSVSFRAAACPDAFARWL